MNKYFLDYLNSNIELQFIRVIWFKVVILQDGAVLLVCVVEMIWVELKL